VDHLEPVNDLVNALLVDLEQVLNCAILKLLPVTILAFFISLEAFVELAEQLLVDDVVEERFELLSAEGVDGCLTVEEEFV
jgi:hypothetical protein